VDQLTAMLWIESEAIFLWISDSPSLLMASQKIAIRGLREIRMIKGHARIEHGKCVTCWLGFSL
jgi:hypothetical protein